MCIESTHVCLNVFIIYVYIQAYKYIFTYTRACVFSIGLGTLTCLPTSGCKELFRQLSVIRPFYHPTPTPPVAAPHHKTLKQSSGREHSRFVVGQAVTDCIVPEHDSPSFQKWEFVRPAHGLRDACDFGGLPSGLSCSDTCLPLQLHSGHIHLLTFRFVSSPYLTLCVSLIIKKKTLTVCIKTNLSTISQETLFFVQIIYNFFQ